jgi:photosystem II stability/assembly factor-like uncharacterized protein
MPTASYNPIGMGHPSTLTKAGILSMVAGAAAGVMWLVSCQSGVSGTPPTPNPAASPPATAAAAPSSEPSPSPDANPLTVSAIQRLSAQVGFIAGWTGTGVPLAETTDGGLTWKVIPIPASHLTAIRFIDTHVGWAGGFALRNMQGVGCMAAPPPGAAVLPCRGVVLRTTDGGRTWQTKLSIPTTAVYGEPVQDVQAVDGLHAWVLTLVEPCAEPTLPAYPKCPTELRRTTDGGTTWRILLRANIAAMRFATASRGWVAVVEPNGAVEVLVTDNGGTTWRSRLITPSGGPIFLDATTSQTAWLLTRDGSSCSSSTCDGYELFRTVDGGTSWSSLGNPKRFAQGCSTGFLVGPLFASSKRGWLALNMGAGGAQGTGGLLKTDDGGSTWTCASKPPNTDLVSPADSLHVWVASVERGTEVTTLYSSDDGGASWRAHSLAGLH